MKDFNFFGPYISTPKKTRSKGIFVVVLLALVFAAIIFYQYTLYQEVNALEKDIDELQSYIDDPKVNEDLSRVQEKEMKGDSLQEAFNQLEALELQLLQTDILSDEIMADIDSQLPQGVFLSSINLNGTNLSLAGFSENYDDIAQFAHNLREVQSVQTVFVPQIQKNETYYGFTILSTLAKEGQNEN
jgi:type IV pilus assembly protein PilN